MSDPIQRASSIPLPPHQVTSGQHDPLPLSSSRFQEKTAEVRSEASDEVRRGDFETYLDQQSVTTLKKAQSSLFFDPATDIQTTSVYQGPGDAKLF